MPQESNATAQNKMGELYVDFGTKGLGGLLSGLNGVKAQFLLTKTAAEQAIKPLVGLSKNAAGDATALMKLNAVTGLSVRQLQDLKIWSDLNNVSFGELANQIQTMQRNLLDIRLGRGDVSGYQLLGIDPSSLDYRKPMEAFNLIRQRVQQVDEATGALALRQLGFSEDLLYAFKQNNNEFDARLKLNQKEINSLNEQQAAWNRLSATWKQAQDKFISNQKWIVDLLDKTTGFLETINVLTSGTNEQKYGVITDAAKSWGSNMMSFYRNHFLFAQKIGAGIADFILGYGDYLKAQPASAGKSYFTPFPNLPPMTEKGVAPQNYNTLNNSYGGNTTNSINVNQYISGNNAQDIANQTSEILLEEINEMEVLNNPIR